CLADADGPDRGARGRRRRGPVPRLGRVALHDWARRQRHRRRPHGLTGVRLPHHGRFAYSGIRSRPVYDWPRGRRLAVYVGLNLEHFAFGEGLGAELAPSHQPDVLNYSWRDYGNRVGAWRLLDLFDELRLPVSVLLNTALYDYAPELVAACRKR